MIINNWVQDNTGKDTEKTCQPITYNLNIFLRKLEILQEPQFEFGKFMEFHGEGSSFGRNARAETCSSQMR